MQFFPVDSSYASQTAQTAEKMFAKTPEDSFDGVLASFIEEGRTDYSGRPAGFAAQGPESGTISESDARRFAEALRQNGLDEGLVQDFEKLAASGSALTLGSTYKALSGRGRATEELEDGERLTFRSLLGRLGLGKDQQEELLALSDEGDISALARRLEALLKDQNGLEMSREELQTLLKGLDLSANTRDALLASLAGNEGLILDNERLQTVLDSVKAEQSARAASAQEMQRQMRDIMADILATSKNAELSSQVSDARGNRRSEQSEALMQNSVRKNTGMDDLRALADEQTEAGNNGDELGSRREGDSRSDRILATNADSAKKGQSGEGNGEQSALSRFAQRLEVTADSSFGLQSNSQTGSQNGAQQNTATLAANQRQEIFSQVEHGLLRSAQNGMQSLTLQLKPAELGQLTVVLSLHQGEVKATIRAENPDAASVLREQLAELRQALEAQGLKVKELDVQTGPQSQDFAGQWDGHKEHNLMRDASERDRMIRLARIRRDAASEAQAEPEFRAARVVDNGLHIVA
ncbi:flagellar hook-length control protein FliK [Desulfovibrio sp. OttesenSCG-928-G11]|nr:flagellar hook-length control protein FliK [Desulfovibrio sp. OttesenSCG-928-G11]